MKKTFKYLHYIIEHKINVFIEGRKLGLGFWQLLKHDMSKFSRHEFKQYKGYFFGKTCDECQHWFELGEEEPFCNVNLRPPAQECSQFLRTQSKKVIAFEYAWLHHQNHNPHHWQYWLQQKGRGYIALEMPRKDAVEMVADWKAMSRKFKNDPAKWYKENAKSIRLHPKTEKLVENLLEVKRPACYHCEHLSSTDGDPHFLAPVPCCAKEHWCDDNPKNLESFVDVDEWGDCDDFKLSKSYSL